jgi:hypothetical protein
MKSSVSVEFDLLLIDYMLYSVTHEKKLNKIQTEFILSSGKKVECNFST